MSDDNELPPTYDAAFFRSVLRGGGTNMGEGHGELVEYLRSGKPVGKGERMLLAQMLAGEWRKLQSGQLLKADKKQEYAQLITDAKKMKEDLRSKGMPALEAHEKAAKWAAAEKQSRNKTWKTIRRKMQNASAG